MAAGGFSCAVCLEDYPEEACAELPCCTIPATATTRFCRRCIEIICESAPGGVGRCPNCRSYVRVSETGGLETADQMGTCTMCTQLRVIVESRGPIMLCDSCLLGTNHALRYECDGCGRFQRIPHPMWRYQQTPNDFGTDTWFCHVRCHAQTHWRLAMQDAALVPPADTPESWGRQVLTLAHVFHGFAHMSGSHLSSRVVSPHVCDRRFCRREEWLASIRAQRLRERRGVGVNAAPPRLTPGQRARELANILACAGTLLCWMQWSAGGWRLHLGGAIWCVAFMLKYGPGGQGRRA